MTASAVTVARAISHRVGTLGNVQLQKLLYYVQAWSLAVNGESAYADANKAWKMGPVVPCVWHEFKDVAQPYAPVRRQDAPDEPLGDELDGIINLVIAEYGSLSGSRLSSISHDEAPWAQAREGLDASAPSNNPIDTDTMMSYYRRHGSLLGMAAWGIQAIGSASFSSTGLTARGADAPVPGSTGVDPETAPLMSSANLKADIPEYTPLLSINLPRA